MDFFDRQQNAQKTTRLLVLYFGLGVGLLVVTLYLGSVIALSGTSLNGNRFGAPHWWNLRLFLGVTACTLAVVGIGCAEKRRELSQGGSAVAEMVGARPVNASSTDLAERRLLNVVEEMSLASGIPVPPVYVLDGENGINAFAAGYTTSDAVVTVTRGALDHLSRDELQGVIGHEFSHILNGDMRLNMRLTALVAGIMCLTIIGRFMMEIRPRDVPNRLLPALLIAFLGLLLVVLGYIGVFFGRLIQAAVSRQREFLADASAVQFTRNPQGLSGALQKIGGYSLRSVRQISQAEQISHMFFGDSVREDDGDPMSTHPPLAARIRAIDPDWNGKFPAVSKMESQVLDQASRDLQKWSVNKMAEVGMGAVTVADGPGNGSQAVQGDSVSGQIRFAVDLRDSIPSALREASRDPLGATALIYGMLLDSVAEERARQREIVLKFCSEAILRETDLLYPDVSTVGARAKLPLIDLALGGLRHLSSAQFEQFSQTMEALISSDGKVDLHEYVLQKVVRRHLEPRYLGARKPVIQYYAIKALGHDCSVILSGLAQIGTADPALATAAFRRGADRLNKFSPVQLDYLRADQWDLAQMEISLVRLGQAVPQIKRILIEACEQTVAADGVIAELEVELLRAIADTLDCPIPPWAQTQSA